eukprot:EG_transcript_22842
MAAASEPPPAGPGLARGGCAWCRVLVDRLVDLQPDNQPPRRLQSSGSRRPCFPQPPVGGVRSVLQLLLAHPRSSRVAETVFGALLDLLADTEPEADSRRLWMATHGIPSLTSTMLLHGACRTVVLSGSALLQTLQQTSRGKKALAEQTTLLPLLQALGQWKSDADVVAPGLAVLVSLSTVREGRLALTVLGAIDLVLHAMLLHPDNGAVQAPGCAFLHNMALSPLALPRLWAAGAVEAAVEAVRRLPGDRRVLARAFPALCLLCCQRGPKRLETPAADLPLITLGR